MGPPVCSKMRVDVLRGGEVEALVGLGHEVADVDAGGAGRSQGLGDAL